jgi:DNA repair exonuclease SbcCD nuclease subunit
VAVHTLAYIQNESNESPPFPKVESDGCFHIAAAHATLTDELGTFIAEGERALKVRLEDLAERGYDYIALGHIHTAHNEWTRGRTGAAYPGLIEGKSFGDPGGAGLLLINPSARPPRIERVPFARHRLVNLEIHLQEVTDESELENRILKFAADLQPEDGLEPRTALKLVLHGHPSFSLDVEKVRARLARQFLTLDISMEDSAWRLGDWARWKREETLRGAFVRKALEKMDAAQSREEQTRIREAAALGLHTLKEAAEDV